MAADSPDDDRLLQQTLDRRRRIKAAARLGVILLVAVGLGLAIRDSLRQLDAQGHRLTERIERLDRQIAATPDAGRSAALIRQRQQLEASRGRPRPIDWRWLVAAALIYAVGLLPAGIYWHRVLRAFGQRAPLGQAVAAHLLGHLGKYVPGKAMVVVIRAGAIAGPDVRAVAAGAAVFVETLTMMATGAALSAAIIGFSDAQRWVTVLAVALAVAASLPTLPPLFQQALHRIAGGRIGGRWSLPSDAIDWRLFGSGWLWMTCGWLLIGGSFACIVVAASAATTVPPGMVQLSGQDLAIAAAAMGLAVVAGFVSLIPGGAGVRELVLSAVLAPRIGPGAALLAAVLARLVFLAVEVLVAGLAWGYLRRGGSSLSDVVDRGSGD